MSKRKRQCLPYWASAKNENNDSRFIQIGNSLLLCDEFQELSASEQHLYFCMMMEAGGRPDFKFPKRSFCKYGISVATARRGIDGLIQKRFITKTSMQNLRKDNEYKFIVDWKTP